MSASVICACPRTISLTFQGCETVVVVGAELQGLVGPARFFAGKYRSLYLGFAIGVVLPIIPWWIYRRRPALGKRLHLDKLSVPRASVFRAALTAQSSSTA